MEISGQPATGFSPSAGHLLGLPLQSRQGERAQLQEGLARYISLRMWAAALVGTFQANSRPCRA